MGRVVSSFKRVWSFIRPSSGSLEQASLWWAWCVECGREALRGTFTSLSNLCAESLPPFLKKRSPSARWLRWCWEVTGVTRLSNYTLPPRTDDSFLRGKGSSLTSRFTSFVTKEESFRAPLPLTAQCVKNRVKTGWVSRRWFCFPVTDNPGANRLLSSSPKRWSCSTCNKHRLLDFPRSSAA